MPIAIEKRFVPPQHMKKEEAKDDIEAIKHDVFFYKSNKNKKKLNITLFIGVLLFALKGGATLLDAEYAKKCSECVKSQFFLGLDNVHPVKECFCENMNTLKEAFYYKVFYSLPSWSQVANHQYAIMGRTGIFLYRGEDVKQANNIDLIVSNENAANVLLTTICDDIQKFIYTNYGELMVSVDTRRITQSEVMSGISIKSGHVSLYCNSSLVASVKIFIKPEWMEKIKSQKLTLNINQASIGSIDILTPESYIEMDLAYLEKELPLVNETCSSLTIESYLPLALSACRTLHIVEKKMLFYEQHVNSQPDIVNLFNNLRLRFNNILSHLNKNKILISHIRDKALQFKYQLGQPAMKFPKMSYAGAVTGGNETTSEDVSSFENLKMLLARDFFVTETVTDGDCFYQSVANALNLTQKTQALFMDACERLLSKKPENINAQLIRDFIHCWIEKVFNIPNISQEELRTFLGLSYPVKTVLENRHIKESALGKMAKKDDYWRWVDLLAAISLPTGIPILVLTPDSHSKMINRAVYSAASLEDVYQGVFLKLKKDPSLYTAHQLSINYLITIINVRKSDHFNSCIPTPFLVTKLKPFIISEEMLLNFVSLPNIAEEITTRREPVRKEYELQFPTQDASPVSQNEYSLTEKHPQPQLMEHCLLIYEDETDSKKTSCRKKKNKKSQKSQTGKDSSSVPIHLPLVNNLSPDALAILKKLQYCFASSNKPTLILHGSVAMLLNAVKDYKQSVAIHPRDWDFKIHKESLSVILKTLDISVKFIDEIIKFANGEVVEELYGSTDKIIFKIEDYMNDKQNLEIRISGGNGYPVSTLSIELYCNTPCSETVRKKILLIDLTLVDDINAYPNEIINIANIGNLPVLKWEGILNHAEEIMSINPLNRQQRIVILEKNIRSYSKLSPKIKIWMDLENKQPILEKNLRERLKSISDYNAMLDTQKNFKGMEISNNSQDIQPGTYDSMDTGSNTAMLLPPEDKKIAGPDIAGAFSSLSLSAENKSSSKIKKPISPTQSSRVNQKPVIQNEKKVNKQTSVADGAAPRTLISSLQNKEKQSEADDISVEISESIKLSATGDEIPSQRRKKKKKKVVGKHESVKHVAGTIATIFSETQPVNTPKHISPEYQVLTHKFHEVKNFVIHLVKKGISLQDDLKQKLSTELFEVILGYITDHQKQLKSKSDDRAIVLLDKCDDHVMDALKLTDQLGHPVAPLILGIKKMVSIDFNNINFTDVMDIVSLYQKAASRRNIQGPVFLYWLAEITGIPEAFSASLQSLKYIALPENPVMQRLIFKTRLSLGCHIQNSETMLIPIRIKRMISQQESGDFSHEDRAFLEKVYPINVNVQAQLTPGLLYQQDYPLAHNKWVNTLIHMAHFGYYYLLIGKSDQAIEHFMHAAVAYSLLEKAGEKMPNIARACGLSSVYHCLHFIDNYRLSQATPSVPASLQYWNNFWGVIGDALKYNSTSHFAYFALENYQEKRLNPDSLEIFEAKMTYLMSRLVNTSWMDNHTLLREIQERHSCFTGEWPTSTDHLVEWYRLEETDNQKKESEVQDDSKRLVKECSKQETPLMIKQTCNQQLKRPSKCIHGKRAAALDEENRKKLNDMAETFNPIIQEILDFWYTVNTKLSKGEEVQLLFDDDCSKLLTLCNKVQQALDFDIVELRNQMKTLDRITTFEQHLSLLISTSFLLFEIQIKIAKKGQYEKKILEFAYFIYDLSKKTNEAVQTKIKKDCRESNINYRDKFKKNLIELLDPNNYKKVDETLILLSLNILLINFDGLLNSLSKDQRKAIFHLMKTSVNYLDAYDDVFLFLDIFVKIGVKNNDEVLLLSDILFKCWLSIPYSFEYDEQDSSFEYIIHHLVNMNNFDQKKSLISICKESLAFREDERQQLLQKKIEDANIVWEQLWEEEKTSEELAKKASAEKKLKEFYSVKHDEENDEHISDEDNTVWVFNTNTENYYNVSSDVLDDDALFPGIGSKMNMKNERQPDLSQKPVDHKAGLEHVTSFKDNKDEKYFMDNMRIIIKLVSKKEFKSAIDKLNELLETCHGDSLAMARIYILKSDYQLEMLKLERNEFKDKNLAEYFKKVMIYTKQYEQVKMTTTLPDIKKSDIWNICNHMDTLMKVINSEDHPFFQAIKDLAQAINILEMFLTDSDDCQNLFGIKTEFDLLSADYTYLRLNLMKIISSCDQITQLVQDRQCILKEIQRRKEMAPQKRLQSSHPVNKLFVSHREIWSSQRASMKKKDNQDNNKSSYYLDTPNIQKKMEKIKNSAELLKKNMPDQTIIDQLNLVLQR